jgi:hypothetical protein
MSGRREAKILPALFLREPRPPKMGRTRRGEDGTDYTDDTDGLGAHDLRAGVRAATTVAASSGRGVPPRDSTRTATERPAHSPRRASFGQAVATPRGELVWLWWQARHGTSPSEWRTYRLQDIRESQPRTLSGLPLQRILLTTNPESVRDRWTPIDTNGFAEVEEVEALTRRNFLRRR